MAYQTIPPSNSGSQDSVAAAWATNIAAFTATKDATINKVRWLASNADLSVYDRPAVGSSGAGYLVQPTGYTSYALRLASGTTISSSVTTRNRTQAVAAGASVYDNPIANGRTTHWMIAADVIIDAVTATCDLFPIAISDEATQTVYLGVNGATSTTAFVIKIGSAAIQTTGVSFGTLGQTVSTVMLLCDGTNVSAYINNNTTAAVSGASNTGPNAAAHPILYAANGATAANAQHTVLRSVLMTA